jgi:lysophospholipase L1-like esterase
MVDDAATRPRRKRRLRSKLLLALAATIAAMLLLEVAVRVRCLIVYGRFDPVDAYEVHAASGLRVPIPLQSGRITTDEHGFRNPPLEDPKPPGLVRIAFLGGSTTWCAEASSDETTWTRLVCDMLREEYPERRFDYVNASASGYTVEHSLLNLRYRVAPLEPDVIVIYHATNDLTKDTRQAAIDQGIYAGSGESWLDRWSMAWTLIRKNFLLRQLERGATEDQAGKLKFDAEKLAALFEARLLELVRACQEVAPVVAVVTFSHRVRREQSAEEQLVACNTSLYYMPFMTPDGILRGIEAYNDAIRRVAAATGALAVGGEHLIPADATHFNDSVHFLDPGCKIMAKRIVDALVESDALR